MSQTGNIVGIIGGGQLGRMLTEAALPLGFKVVVLDPVANSPAAQAGAKQIVRDYSMSALEQLASETDFLTTEFEEGLEPEQLNQLQKHGTKLNPAPQTIGLIIDKLNQKNYLVQNGIAMGPYAPIENVKEAEAILKKYGGKMVIKTRRGGYDGYGNRVVNNSEQIKEAFIDFAGRPVYAEAFVQFKKELACIAVRNIQDKIITYPVVETIQKNNICHEVLAPADIEENIYEQATTMARKVASLFEGAGAFGIEMFLTENGEVWLNEIAPRVHNSGHYTIEACVASQFKNHILAITGRPLESPEMKVPAAVMINILGERNGPVELKGLAEASAIPHTTVHIYGKSPTKIGRKMGHITAVGQTLEQARNRARAARGALSI